jgi:hypothetical protein
MSTVVFDSATLITCCQGVVNSQPIIETLLALTEIVVPSSVEHEVVTAGRRFLDWVVDLVLKGTWDQAFGEAVTNAVAHRFSGGFVPPR